MGQAMSNLLKMMAGGAETLYVDDVFSTYLYTGNNSTQTITNGIDLASKGGLVWTKARDNNPTQKDHQLMDSARGFRYSLESNNTDANFDFGADLVSATSSGFTLSSASRVNQSGFPYVSWTFRKAPKFFDVVTYTGNGNSYRDGIPHSLGITPGMIIIKAYSTTGDWIVWHRASTNSGNDNLSLNQTLAAQTGQYSIQDATSTKFAVANDTSPNSWPANTNGVSYVAYLFAHDTSSTGIVQCGSFTTDGSGNATVNHGWSAGVQFAAIKASSTSGYWEMYDTARTSGWSGNDARLSANLSNAEDSVARLSASGTSVSFAGLSASATYVYVFFVAPT